MDFISNKMIIGVDEVGKGSWAGPMLVIAFASVKGWSLPGLKDSKDYTSHKARQKIADVLHDAPRCVWSTRYVNAPEIDALGMKLAHANAIRDAIEVCINMLQPMHPGLPERIIVDGDMPQPFYGVECIPHADALFPQVSAASVLAKVQHDTIMWMYHTRFPGYGFDTNVGYGTEKHEDGIKAQGLCPIHRRSFSPMKNYLLDPTLALPSFGATRTREGEESSRDAGGSQPAGGYGRSTTNRSRKARR